MLIGDQNIQSIWYDLETDAVNIIDQTRLPHEFEIITLKTLHDACHAITTMQVRGAPLIGVTAAYGLYLALRKDPAVLEQAIKELLATRRTAVNLRWALQRSEQVLIPTTLRQRAAKALETAQLLEKEDIAICQSIGEHGATILKALWKEKQSSKSVLNVLTHCNAGALATVDWGTALAVVYKAVAAGVPIHVWVDETRPRSQGASLTAWELSKHGVSNTLIVDNAGGHLMQNGKVNMCIVGSDRTASNGDVCNKIGTYMKALCAYDNNIPFYVALPESSIDFNLKSGINKIEIEERSNKEVTHIRGINSLGELSSVKIVPDMVKSHNPGFDVTPARLVTKLITDKGICNANSKSISELFKNN